MKGPLNLSEDMHNNNSSMIINNTNGESDKSDGEDFPWPYASIPILMISIILYHIIRIVVENKHKS